MAVIFPDPVSATRPPYLLRLFISKWATSSQRAITNLTELIKEHYPLIYRLEIIDINQHPEMVIAENVTAVPLLLKQSPEPSRRLVGDMSNRLKVIAGLQLPDQPQTVLL
jgi:circadian clock protein KaiB